MAFALVNVAHGQGTGGGSTNVTCNKPTNTADNDIMIALVAQAHSAANIVTVPAGWSSLCYHINGNYKQRFYWKVASGEGASYTWIQNNVYGCEITIASYRGGFNPADPIDVYSNTEYVASDTTWRAASVATASVLAPLVFIAVDSSETLTFTKPTAPADVWSEDTDYCGSLIYTSREFARMTWSGSGATGAIDAVGTKTKTTSKHAIVVALKRLVGKVISCTNQSDAVVDIQFNVPVDATTANDETKWTITKNGGGDVPTFTATRQATTSIVQIVFDTPPDSGNYTIEATAVLDDEDQAVDPNNDSAVATFAGSGSVNRCQAWVF